MIFRRFPKVNLIMKICFFAATLVVASLLAIFVNYMEPMIDKYSDFVHKPEYVEAGQVGGKPTEDTFVVTSYDDLLVAIENDYLFTIQYTSSYSLFPGSVIDSISSEYMWRTVKLDGHCIPAIINWDNFEEKVISTSMLGTEQYEYKTAVCRVVEGPCEMQEEFNAKWEEDAVAEFYIDMDGEAKSAHKSMDENVMMILLIVFLIVILIMILPTILGLTFLFANIVSRIAGKSTKKC